MSFFSKILFVDRALYSGQAILLKNQLEDVKLEELKIENYKSKAEKMDNFNEIIVDGSVFFDGLVNDLNATKLCDFAFGSNEHKKLIIEGLHCR